MQSFSAGQLGLTLVQSVLPGIHAGATLKYVRGTVRVGTGEASRSNGDLLDAGEDLDGGKADNQFDLDAGVMMAAGPFRLGAVTKNLRRPTFVSGASQFTLPRQTRIGAAIDAQQGGGLPFTLAIDADVQT